MAAGLATALAACEDVVLYTRRDRGIPDAPFAQESVLTGDLHSYAHLLAKERVDCWLALTAGLLPLAGVLEPPFVGYMIGNDFLRPWLGYHNRWVDSLGQLPYFWRFKPALQSVVRRRQIRKGVDASRRILTLSTAVAELASRLFPNVHDKLSVVPPGVADQFFQAAERRPAGPLRLLTVSRLKSSNPRKNVEGVLRALTLLPGHIPFNYKVVGDGDDRSRLERLAIEIGLQQQVSFLGHVSNADLLAAYRQADLFVLPARASSTDVEGFGIVYLEASAAGLPVLASREGGSVDAICDGWNGLLIPNSSPEDIARGIERFAETRDLFPSERVRSFAERFRWPRVVAALREELLSCLG